MPSIETRQENHRRYCTSPAHHASDWGRAGDVRRCAHGRIQLAYDVPGSMAPYWRDLHPIFDPIRYQRARRALKGEA